MKTLKLILITGTLALIGSRASANITFDSLVSIPMTGIGEARTENGFTVEFFWYSDVGGAGTNVGGHSHLVTLSIGNFAELQHFNGSTEIQGFRITQTGGGLFSLTSLDYNGQVFSSIVDGYTSPNILLATSFNPTQSLTSQFTAFGVVSAAGLTTLNVSGFESVSEVWVTSSSSILFDNINLGAPRVPNGVPDSGSTVALMGVACAGLGLAARRKRITA